MTSTSHPRFAPRDTSRVEQLAYIVAVSVILAVVRMGCVMPSEVTAIYDYRNEPIPAVTSLVLSPTRAACLTLPAVGVLGAAWYLRRRQSLPRWIAPFSVCASVATAAVYFWALFGPLGSSQ